MFYQWGDGTEEKKSNPKFNTQNNDNPLNIVSVWQVTNKTTPDHNNNIQNRNAGGGDKRKFQKKKTVGHLHSNG